MIGVNGSVAIAGDTCDRSTGRPPLPDHETSGPVIERMLMEERPL